MIVFVQQPSTGMSQRATSQSASKQASKPVCSFVRPPVRSLARSLAHSTSPRSPAFDRLLGQRRAVLLRIGTVINILAVHDTLLIRGRWFPWLLFYGAKLQALQAEIPSSHGDMNNGTSDASATPTKPPDASVTRSVPLDAACIE